jgi:hypothetical protein
VSANTNSPFCRLDCVCLFVKYKMDEDVVIGGDNFGW